MKLLFGFDKVYMIKSYRNHILFSDWHTPTMLRSEVVVGFFVILYQHGSAKNGFVGITVNDRLPANLANTHLRGHLFT